MNQYNLKIDFSDIISVSELSNILYNSPIQDNLINK